MNVRRTSASSATVSRIVQTTLAMVAVVATLLLASPSPASAHATLLFTSPAANTAVADAPKVVQLVFDEEVVARDSSMRITGESGTETEVGTIQQVDTTTVRAPIPRTLQPGTYAVSWQAGADDGDLMSGAFDFVIGDEKALTASQATSSASDSMGVAIARWAMWLGLASSLGGLAGERMVRRVEHPPARRAGGLLVPVGLVLGMLGSLAGLIFYATSGSPVGGLVAHVAGSTPGRVLLVELSAFTLGVVGAATRLSAPRSSILLLALLAVPVAEGFRAHPANSTTWGVVFTAVHLTAVAVWVGGLAKVLWVAKSLRASGRAAGPVFVDYSRWALGAFVVVVLSGVASSIAIASPGEVISAVGQTLWGWLMLLKLALVVAIAVMALAARRVLRRRRLNPTLRIARIEVIALVMVVGFSAFVTTSTPPAADAGTLQAAPPTVGEPVSGGTRAGQIGIGVVASEGQVVVRLSVPTETFSDSDTLSFEVDAAIANGGPDTRRTEQLKTTPCGEGCFVAPAQLRTGSNVVTVRVSSNRWVGGSSAVVIDWPAQTGDATLATVIDVMERTPTLTLFEKVTSNTRQNGLPSDTFSLSGREFIAAEPYSNGKAAEANVSIGRSGTVLSLAYPSEGIYVRLLLDEQDRVIRESLSSAKHLVTRVFVYEDPPRSSEDG